MTDRELSGWARPAARVVHGSVNYAAAMSVRPRYHANDSSRDVLDLDPRLVRIEDVRAPAAAPSLASEGEHARLLAVELHAEGDQLVNPVGALCDQDTDSLDIAQPGPGGHVGQGGHLPSRVRVFIDFLVQRVPLSFSLGDHWSALPPDA